MNILKKAGYNLSGREVAKNELDVTFGDFITIKGGFADKAVVWDLIVGISEQKKVFDADNETVKQEYLTFYGLDDYAEVEASTTATTILDQAMIWTDFDLDANGVVDDATAGAGTQLRLTKVVSDTVGRFKRVQA